jgi:hypothetical protein
MRAYFLISLLGMATLIGGVNSASAADPCSGFKWDVSKEHSLFGGSATSLPAGKDLAAAPTIETDRLYRLQLTPQDQVTFAVPPGHLRSRLRAHTACR